MKIPTKFELDGHTWTVVRKSMKRDAGTCEHWENRITLDSDLKGLHLEEVWLHELLHCCFPKSIVDHDTEEALVDNMAPVLLRALKAAGAIAD